jgi:hypothetical protein
MSSMSTTRGLRDGETAYLVMEYLPGIIRQETC